MAEEKSSGLSLSQKQIAGIAIIVFGLILFIIAIVTW